MPVSRTEELFATSALFNNFNQSRFQLFDRGYVLSEDTHISRLGRNVDLYTGESSQVSKMRAEEMAGS